jgi:hypothetical protein
MKNAHYILMLFGQESWIETLRAGGGNAKKRAIIAVDRKLSVMLHKLWVSGEFYEPLRSHSSAASAVAWRRIGIVERNRRVQVTAAMSWSNWHRAKKSRSSKGADGRMATEAARLKPKDPLGGKPKTNLTLTGLLMEGLGPDPYNRIHVFENCGRILFAKDTICSRNSVVTMK